MVKEMEDKVIEGYFVKDEEIEVKSGEFDRIILRNLDVKSILIGANVKVKDQIFCENVRTETLRVLTNAPIQTKKRFLVKRMGLILDLQKPKVLSQE